MDLLLFPLPVQEADLACEPVFREPLLLAAPSDHKVKDKPVVERTDLNGETVLPLEPGHRLHEQVRDLCNQYGATLSHDYEGTSLDTLRQMVAMNIGATFVPALYARSEIRTGSDVVARSLRGRLITRSIGLVWRRGAGRADAFRAISDEIRDIARRNFDELIFES